MPNSIVGNKYGHQLTSGCKMKEKELRKKVFEKQSMSRLKALCDTSGPSRIHCIEHDDRFFIQITNLSQVKSFR